MLLATNVSTFERELTIAPIEFKVYCDRYNYLSIEATLPFDDECFVTVNLPMRLAPNDQPTVIISGPRYRSDWYIYDLETAQAIAAGDKPALGVDVGHYLAMLEAMRTLLADPDVAFHAGLMSRDDYEEWSIVMTRAQLGRL